MIKYVEVEKIVEKPVVKIVEVDKPIFIDKIKQIEVEKIIEKPVQVYVEKPVIVEKIKEV